MRCTPLLFALVCVAQAACADETQLDLSFGIGGRYNNTPTKFMKTFAHLPFPGGGSIAVTHFHDVDANNLPTSPEGIGFKRFDSSGQFVNGSDFGNTFRLTQVGGAALDSLGRIVVVGSHQVSGTNYDFRVMRMMPTGGGDNSFGGDGVVDIAFNLGSGNGDLANAVAIDAQDRIVVVGQVQRAASGDSDFATIRLLANGTLDPAFSGDGIELTPFDLGPSLQFDAARAVVIGIDGRIVVGGIAYDSGVNADRIALVRLTSSGNQDPTFCQTSCNFMAGYTSIHSGRRVTFFGSNAPAHDDSLKAMAVDRIGDLLVAGTTPGVGETLGFVQRFESTGWWQYESSTQGGGGGTVDIGGVHWQDPTVPYGNVVMTGVTGQNENFFFAQRFTTLLSPSPNWGGFGPSNSVYAWTASGGFGDAGANRPAMSSIEPSGRVLVGGGYKPSVSSTYGSTISRLTYNGPTLGVFFKDSFE